MNRTLQNATELRKHIWALKVKTQTTKHGKY